jgi:hypothetical protein
MYLIANDLATDIDPEDQSDEEDEKLPDLTVDVDDEGYPCLPTGFESLMLKNQQKVVRKVFQKAYGDSFLFSKYCIFLTAYIQQRSSQTTLGLQSPGVILPKIQTITLTWTVSLGMSSSRILLTCRRKLSV